MYALISFQTAHHQPWLLNLTHQYNWPAGIAFTSLNILSVVAVLSAVGKEMKGVGEAKIASILSGLVFGAISYMYNETLVELAGELAHYEIPLFAVLEGAPFPILFYDGCSLRRDLHNDDLKHSRAVQPLSVTCELAEMGNRPPAPVDHGAFYINRLFKFNRFFISNLRVIKFVFIGKYFTLSNFK